MTRGETPPRKTKDIDSAFLMQITKLRYETWIHGKQWRFPLYGLPPAVSL